MKRYIVAKLSPDLFSILSINCDEVATAKSDVKPELKEITHEIEFADTTQEPEQGSANRRGSNHRLSASVPA